MGIEEMLLTIFREIGIVEAIQMVKEIDDIAKSLSDKLLLRKMRKVLLRMGEADSETRMALASGFRKKIGDDPDKQFQFISIIQGISEIKKYEYYADLITCYLVVTDMTEPLFNKLVSLLDRCTASELSYLKSFPYEQSSPLTIEISYLYREGLFDQRTNDENTEVRYKLSPLGIALKLDSLNYRDGTSGHERPLTLEDVGKLDTGEPLLSQDIGQIIGTEE